MYRIMIVEDDDVIAESVASRLKAWDYEVCVASDLKNIMNEFTAFLPQLVIMDIALPFYNGYHWCGEIRKVSKVPVIFLSSFSENMNIVMAVNMGADDFIAKPFDFDVLTAKVQALLRRAYSFSGDSTLLEAGGAVLNIGDATLHCGGNKTELTKNELRILEVLMRERGRIISRDTLAVKLWETDSFVDDNTLTVNMTRLRHKLEELGVGDLIKTKKGMGYMVE